MSTPDLFGWDLLYRLVENDIHKKEDVLVILIHHYLIKSGFRSVGIGEDRTLTDQDQRSELLPRGWSDLEKIALRYAIKDDLYILHGIISEGTAVFNLLKLNGLTVSNVVFNLDETVAALKGTLPTMVPSYNTVFENIKQSLVDPVFNGIAKDVQTQTPHPTSPRAAYVDPLSVGPSRNPPSYNPAPPHRMDLLRDINNAGQRDLDPFGFSPIGGPGNIGPGVYDPFHPNLRGRGSGVGPIPGVGVPGGLGRGAIPPGARFDPFGPPDADLDRPGRRLNPDNDHLPPPGYDDMFT